MEKKQMTFVSACKDFFGFKPGQTLGEFAAEVKTLSQKDKDDIKAGLEQNGYSII